MVHLAEVLYEHRVVGSYVKVSAIDPVTYTEVSIVGPASASQSALEDLARKKLIYVLNKRRRSGARGQGSRIR